MKISATELKNRLNQTDSLILIDVREKIEFYTFNIGGHNIPLKRLLSEVNDLGYNKNQEFIVICQHGIRSETARNVLTQNGYTDVKNLTGGLLAWQRAEL